MSSKMKWVLIVVVIILAVLGFMWWGGMLGSSGSSQPAAVANGTVTSTPATNPDDVLTQASSTIDTQIKAVTALASSLNKNSTPAGVDAVVAAENSLVGAVSQFGGTLKARLTKAGLATTEPYQSQLSDANSKILLASASVAKAASLMKSTSTVAPTATQQAISELQNALNNVRLARVDLGVIAQGVKGK